MNQLFSRAANPFGQRDDGENGNDKSPQRPDLKKIVQRQRERDEEKKPGKDHEDSILAGSSAARLTNPGRLP